MSMLGVVTKLKIFNVSAKKETRRPKGLKNPFREHTYYCKGESPRTRISRGGKRKTTQALTGSTLLQLRGSQAVSWGDFSYTNPSRLH